MTEGGQFVEIQSSGEEAVFSEEELSALLELGRRGVQQIIAAQRSILGI
jgi:ribonuclease PH